MGGDVTIPYTRLLKWMDNYVTGHYAGPKINNFNKDWNDGTKLGALVDSKAPGW